MSSKTVLTPGALAAEFRVAAGQVHLLIGAGLRQNPTTGAIEVAPRAFLQVARVSAPQVINAVGQDFIFDQLLLGQGIAYNAATGVAQLARGVVYRLAATLSFATFSTSTARVGFGFVDATTNVLLGGVLGLGVPANAATTLLGPSSIELFWQPAADQGVKLRCLSLIGRGTIANSHYSGYSILAL